MYICKYCGKEYEKASQLAGHCSHCQKHPNLEYHNIVAKRIGDMLKDYHKNGNGNKLKIYNCTCNKCGKIYSLTIKESDFKNGRYTKYCSKSCANSRTHSSEVKDKISKGLHEYHIRTNTERQPKRCKVCGEIYGTCKYPEICNHKVKSWWNNLISFGLDISKFGTEDIYNEYNKVKNILYTEYIINELSPKDIYDKYNCSTYINHNETILHIIKSFGIKHRSYSEATKNAVLQGKLDDVYALNQYKCGWHKSWNGKEHYLRSSYEFDYANSLDELQIDYETEYFHIKYFHTDQQTFKCAIPDFYLPETNTIVEIKSNYTLSIQEMKDKFKAYTELGYNTKLILDHKEVDLYSL